MALFKRAHQISQNQKLAHQVSTIAKQAAQTQVMYIAIKDGFTQEMAKHARNAHQVHGVQEEISWLLVWLGMAE